MKRPLQAIAVSLAIFTLFSTRGEAGPIGDFFRSMRNSLTPPAPKPRTAQSHRSGRKRSNETPPSDASNASNNQTSPTPTPLSAPPSQNNIRVAKATATRTNRKSDIPYGIPVPGKPGLVTSPFSPDSGYIDVRSFPSGTEVRDPYTGKSFLTP
jgi:hypothetical protein